MRARARDGDDNALPCVDVEFEVECVMPNDPELNPAVAEQLSALADGELEASAVAAACASWRDSESARARWHSYQLIGDVLRSDDLASSAEKDASFMLALRARLSTEAVVLAPEPLVAAVAAEPHRESTRAARGRGWSWMAPSAVAAGFVAVAGMLMVTQSPAPGADPIGGVISSVRPSESGAMMVAAPASSAPSLVEPQALVADGPLIRDVRLDRYLAAHKQFAGVSVLGMPSGFVRSVTTEAPKR